MDRGRCRSRVTAPVSALVRVLEEVYGFYSIGGLALLCQFDISYFRASDNRY